MPDDLRDRANAIVWAGLIGLVTWLIGHTNDYFTGSVWNKAGAVALLGFCAAWIVVAGVVLGALVLVKVEEIARDFGLLKPDR